MITIKRINNPSWQTEDGQIHDTFLEAQRHARKLKLLKIFGGYAFCDSWALEDVVAHILDHSEDMASILSGNPQIEDHVDE